MQEVSKPASTVEPNDNTEDKQEAIQLSNFDCNIDFDTDGEFDYMISVDDNGEANSEAAYFKETQEWEEVSESNKDKDRMKINDTAYIFNPYEGWKEVDQAEL